MSNRVRQILAVMAATLMLSTSMASATVPQSLAEAESAYAPAALDVMLLRPAGFVSFVIGTGLFLAVSPIILITRPHEIDRPFKQMVVRPAKYLWVDPIGSH